MAHHDATGHGSPDDRKARLAKLKSLKRKQPTEADADETETTSHDDFVPTTTTTTTAHPNPNNNTQDPPTQDVARLHLSGRNYDFETKGPKLGFEAPPTLAQGQATLEEQARDLEEESRRQEAADADAQQSGGAPAIDLFKLQPKRPNWDLKRELALRTEVLHVRTENAIARLVRERLAEKKAAAANAGAGGGAGGGGAGGQQEGDAEAEGMLDGAAIVEGMRLREREEEEENRREREAEAAEFGMA
ncbi:cwf18 pre-mRNA splicing factor-domain-containing protein [Chaetomium tenue]|uniref:Cwf18 pre-mRNA splicing factor-domain-containing protein n=1 Tax=Chaetomium tenue TaxID=1854479 RepID=A0ACB7PNN9_9PEZI|nr:cwf18 pre-mRNA splicing factor-domain-containing protein [Chaetomium globosum]